MDDHWLAPLPSPGASALAARCPGGAPLAVGPAVAAPRALPRTGLAAEAPRPATGSWWKGEMGHLVSIKSLGFLGMIVVNDGE